MGELAIRRCSWVYEIGNRQSNEGQRYPITQSQTLAVERPGVLVRVAATVAVIGRHSLFNSMRMQRLEDNVSAFKV